MKFLYKKIVEIIAGPIYEKMEEIGEMMKNAAVGLAGKLISLDKSLAESNEVIKKISTDLESYRAELERMKELISALQAEGVTIPTVETLIPPATRTRKSRQQQVVTDPAA